MIDYNEWPELRESLYADERPTIVMLKEGMIYHNMPGRDTYPEIYEFIEKGVPENTEPLVAKYPLGGRLFPGATTIRRKAITFQT